MRLRLLVALVALRVTAAPPTRADPAAPPAAEPGVCRVPSAGPAPLRRLTRDQYAYTVSDLLDFAGPTVDLRGTSVVANVTLPPDETVGPFRSNVVAAPTGLDVQQLMEAAERFADRAATQWERMLACDVATQGLEACGRAFVEGFGRRAFRRPLRTAEVDRYARLFVEGSASGGAQAGLRAAVCGLLQSPYLLMHTRGDGETVAPDVVALDPYALASRLSYLLWVSAPDDALLNAAASGALGTAEGLRRETRRLLADDRARRGLGAFHLQWLGVEDVASVAKQGKLYPLWNSTTGGSSLGNALRRETERFVDEVIRHGDGKFATLMTAPYSWLEDPLPEYYGVPKPADPGKPVQLDPRQRAGLLTHGSFLATHAHAAQSSPVARGVLIRKNLLCQDLPDPPPNVNNTPPDPDPKLTTRERFEEHRLSGVCSGCHKLIDPIGFGLENYDAFGRFRGDENGKPIDASGKFVEAGDLGGEFTGAVTLAKRLAGSHEVRSCYVRQWFRYALGRYETPEDSCTLRALEAEFERTGGDVRALLLALPTSDAFRFRRADRATPRPTALAR